VPKVLVDGGTFLLGQAGTSWDKPFNGASFPCNCPTAQILLAATTEKGKDARICFVQ